MFTCMSPLINSFQRFAALQSLAFAIECGSASAALVTYSDLPSYLSASGPVSLESFEQLETLAMGRYSQIDLASLIVRSDGRYGILMTGPSFGQYPTEGAQYLAFMAETVQFVFTKPITALSLDFVDYGDLPTENMGTLSMTTSAGDSVIIKEPGPYPGSGNMFFFGFRSDDPITEVTFHLTRGDIENVAVDAVRYASVPEPSVGLLGVFGAGWMAAQRRRR